MALRAHGQSWPFFSFNATTGRPQPRLLASVHCLLGCRFEVNGRRTREDLFDALQMDPGPLVASAVVLQIVVGDKTHLMRLSQYRRRQKDPEIIHDCGLAMAR